MRYLALEYPNKTKLFFLNLTRHKRTMPKSSNAQTGTVYFFNPLSDTSELFFEKRAIWRSSINLIYYFQLNNCRKPIFDLEEWYNVDITFQATKISQPTKVNCDIGMRTSSAGGANQI